MPHGNTQSIVGLGDGSVIGTGGNVADADNRLDTAVGVGASQATLDSRIDTLELDNTVVVLTAAAAVPYNAALGHVATIAMSADATQTITISNLAAGQSCTVFATQNAAGSTALVFASTFFAGGTEPTMTATASAVDAYTIINIGGQLYGFVAGQDLKT